VIYLCIIDKDAKYKSGQHEQYQPVSLFCLCLPLAVSALLAVLLHAPLNVQWCEQGGGGQKEARKENGRTETRLVDM
jgi:hypothetical protein